MTTLPERDPPIPDSPEPNQLLHPPRALFLGAGGVTYPDALICSGHIPSVLGGQPCPYSKHGRIPAPQPLDPADPTYSIDKGQPGDLCPPCAKQQLTNLGHWQGHGGQTFPDALLELRLFKCRQWFWLVVPGLKHATPHEIDES
ncbi:MAG TPA: hypothetical protein VFZ66_27530 [Herpetosiphonaceae bacterium]